LTPTTGTFRGGNQLLLVDAALALTAENFDDGVLAPRWTDASSGGTVLEQGGGVSFDAAVGEDALIASADPVDDVDVTARLGWSVNMAPRTTAVLAELSLGTAGGSWVRVQWFKYAPRLQSFRVQVRHGTALLSNHAAVLPSSTEVEFRLLRAGTKVYVFLNGAFRQAFEWSDEEATIYTGIRAETEAVAARLLSLTRRPVVRFGDVPALDVEPRTDTLATLTAPEVSPATSSVDVTVTGDASAVLFSGYAYTTPTNLMRAQKLTVTNDSILTVPRS
jgi:hypothetical protein